MNKVGIIGCKSRKNFSKRGNSTFCVAKFLVDENSCRKKLWCKVGILLVRKLFADILVRSGWSDCGFVNFGYLIIQILVLKNLVEIRETYVESSSISRDVSSTRR